MSRDLASGMGASPGRVRFAAHSVAETGRTCRNWTVCVTLALSDVTVRALPGQRRRGDPGSCRVQARSRLMRGQFTSISLVVERRSPDLVTVSLISGKMTVGGRLAAWFTWRRSLLSGTRKRNLADHGLGSRAYAIAANMLEGADGEKWRAQGLSKGDVMLALALGPIFLRINCIELGLKHILDNEMEKPFPKKHDLVMLWNLLTDEWRNQVARESGVPLDDIRETLGHYKDAAVNLRYGGPFGEQGTRPPKADSIRKDAIILQKLANALGGRSHPPIGVREVKPHDP